MEYMLFSSGKRIRPILAIATYESLKKDGRLEEILPFASGIEMIHTYSLIHDDLPAMDNDDFRRGRPTCHRKFGEALAILAGDGLLTEAFRIMTDRRFVKNLKPSVIRRIVFEVAKASGVEGIVGGQTLDIIYEGKKGSKGLLRKIHGLKTASLINASVVIGGIVGGAKSQTLRSLSKYGTLIGLAFQIKDDLLDFEGDEKIVGKRLRKDSEKQSYLRYYPPSETKRILEGLIERAKREIKALNFDLLLEIPDFIKERER